MDKQTDEALDNVWESLDKIDLRNYICNSCNEKILITPLNEKKCSLCDSTNVADLNPEKTAELKKTYGMLHDLKSPI